MTKRKKHWKPRHLNPNPKPILIPVQNPPMAPYKVDDLSSLEKLPVTYQQINDYVSNRGVATNLFDLRKETFKRIERATERPLICYVAKTHHVPQHVPAYIDDSDLTGFDDLIQSTEGEAVDVFIVSNGGSAEATERIVRLLRSRFTSIRFIVPSNAYSATTLLCFSGEEIIMGSAATLGPIDPQINGIPARAILRAFEEVEKRLKNEGPQALPAYMPLLSKYDLHILEICKSAQELSKELARTWLSTYMLKLPEDHPTISAIVDFFSDYDIHKSHGRSIDRQKILEMGLQERNAETIEGLADLTRSLKNQYELFFDKSPFYKVFENSRGIGWGRQSQEVTLQFPVPTPMPQPGPPQRSG